METFVCPVCGKQRPVSQRIAGARLRPLIADRIRKDVPRWDGKTLCRIDLQRYRVRAIREMLQEQRGAVSDLDASVLERMERNQLISRQVADTPDSLGGRVADRIASFGGSWPFLLMFAGTLTGWIIVNTLLLTRPFDPYPFILLNLALSCLAAVQAPVIMMSQNRQELKDRDRAEHDYEINLKAEIELQLLHEKLDHLGLQELQRVLEVQALQTDMLEELLESQRRGPRAHH